LKGKLRLTDPKAGVHEQKGYPEKKTAINAALQRGDSKRKQIHRNRFNGFASPHFITAAASAPNSTKTA
jgi:hypothetical protein